MDETALLLRGKNGRRLLAAIREMDALHPDEYTEMLWSVVISFEPEGREVVSEIEAVSGKEAMMKALAAFDIPQDKLLHTLFAHIRAPRRVSP